MKNPQPDSNKCNQNLRELTDRLKEDAANKQQQHTSEQCKEIGQKERIEYCRNPDEHKTSSQKVNNKPANELMRNVLINVQQAHLSQTTSQLTMAIEIGSAFLL